MRGGGDETRNASKTQQGKNSRQKSFPLSSSALTKEDQKDTFAPDPRPQQKRHKQSSLDFTNYLQTLFSLLYLPAHRGEDLKRNGESCTLYIGATRKPGKRNAIITLPLSNATPLLFFAQRKKRGGHKKTCIQVEKGAPLLLLYTHTHLRTCA